jgi:hypothetical protein
MSVSDRETPGRDADRQAWEPMRFEYLGHVTELVGEDPPGKLTGDEHEGPHPKSKVPGVPGGG